ncbi:MAG: hypothetical protein D6760_06575 [Deltaproteobacteria bacterium]|nr:MAG: hypothetical protein D6760_06575 [Deltaproteobacteria bacterium]
MSDKEATQAAADVAPAAVEQPMPAEHPSAMRSRFNRLSEWALERLYGNAVVNEALVERIRDMASRGTIVYVLRQSSFVDYCLVNFVLRREGLPLPVFANGVSATPLLPLGQMFARVRQVLRERLRGRTPAEETHAHDYCAEAVSRGRPVLIFMRGRRGGGMLGGWLRRTPISKVGPDFLREIVHAQRPEARETFIIPLAPFRGRSFTRREAGLSALVYSVQEAPSELRKLVTYLWNRRDLFITVGDAVALGEFAGRYPEDDEERLVQRLTRAIQIFLHREERVVLGPALLPRRQVKTLVLENEEVSQVIRRLARERGVAPEKLRKEAAGYFDEMAANFNGILFGIVAYFFIKIWNRMFSGLVPIGFDAVVEKVRRHPVVLVPCHRSHFDYLIISYLFHQHFVSPPHIAAGINMAFWPMGPLFRASGAYFIRRSFGDNELYKTVFKQYLKFLIRDGYTQEFFIEGGRSRTGKIMTPRLGMLSAIVNAYLAGVRSDLYLVPVSIHYGRIVEEEAYQRELSGAEKERESFGALLRARRFLRQRYGQVYLSFAEPMSLHDLLGERKRLFVERAGDAEVEEEKRRFVQKLGFQILREVNRCSVAGATSVSATVLLGAPRGGKRYSEYVAQANALAAYVKHRGIVPTASLERNIGDFRESLGFLSASGLIDIIRRGREEIVVARDDKRLALDFYKNNLIHAFLLPALIVFALRSGTSADGELAEEVWWWLDLFRYEFALPERSELAGLVDDELAYLREAGALADDGSLDLKHPFVRAVAGLLDNFREAYWMVARTLIDSLSEDGLDEKSLAEEYSRTYQAGIKLNEVLRPEGNTVVLLRNALNRYRELGFVVERATGRGGRDRLIVPGERFSQLEEFSARLRKALVRGRLPEVDDVDQ